MNQRQIPLDELLKAFRAQGVPREHIAAKCPVCGTVQSAADLIALGVGRNFNEVEKLFAYSCIGRWTDAGPYQEGTPPGAGCDWTLGGMFQFHTLEVVGPDGKLHPWFEPATPKEARAHMEKRRGCLGVM